MSLSNPTTAHRPENQDNMANEQEHTELGPIRADIRTARPVWQLRDFPKTSKFVSCWFWWSHRDTGSLSDCSLGNRSPTFPKLLSLGRGNRTMRDTRLLPKVRFFERGRAATQQPRRTDARHGGRGNVGGKGHRRIPSRQSQTNNISTEDHDCGWGHSSVVEHLGQEIGSLG